MDLRPEEAATLGRFLIAQLSSESKTTLRVFAAVPDQAADYTPHERSLRARDLVPHIAYAEVWFMEGVASGAFPAIDANAVEAMAPSEAARWYEQRFASALQQLNAASPEQLARPLTFRTWTQPAVLFLAFALKHSVHHRGQLSSYLRPMGSKVPAIIGGSADEPARTASRTT